ncbi:PREDICTED: uncharacterized protein LOC105548567 [Mandrillus leucophaeus]|uniref:uncharacterized protein LOC105548567 n=1 Tax=Mandrillus leucophaeus TaxID=9568 RepID=UPI0005F436D3|nr:PREDICTED: uncharacterized protein LOC105548567 [Mandrillus leucophaeus]
MRKGITSGGQLDLGHKSSGTDTAFAVSLLEDLHRLLKFRCLLLQAASIENPGVWGRSPGGFCSSLSPSWSYDTGGPEKASLKQRGMGHFGGGNWATKQPYGEVNVERN